VWRHDGFMMASCTLYLSLQARREVALWEGFEDRQLAVLRQLEVDIERETNVVVTAYDFLLFPGCMRMAAW
jgi:hypothetical protein